MTWSKLTEDFFSNPKIVRAGRDARDLYLAALCHCNEHKTDGIVERGYLRQLAAKADIDDMKGAIAALIRECLWEDDAAGYAIHDFLSHNLSRAEHEALRESRTEAGRRGGHRSGEARRGERPNLCEANTEALASQNTPINEASASQNEAKNEASALAKTNPGFRIPDSGFRDPIPGPRDPLSERASRDPTADDPPDGRSGSSRKGEKVANHAVREFVEAFERHYDSPPDIPARCARSLADTCDRLGRDAYAKALLGYFADDWAGENGHNVVTFLSQPMDRWIRAKPRAPAKTRLPPSHSQSPHSAPLTPGESATMRRANEIEARFLAIQAVRQDVPDAQNERKLT